jgi:hypothetical protein
LQGQSLARETAANDKYVECLHEDKRDGEGQTIPSPVRKGMARRMAELNPIVAVFEAGSQ